MTAPDVSEAASAALATVRAIRGPREWNAHHQLHVARRRRWGTDRFEHLWPFANAWSAVASLARAPAAREVAEEARLALGGYLQGVGRYRQVGTALRPRTAGFESSVVPPLGPGGDRYFDDNAWLGLASLRHHAVTGDPSALELAREAFAFVASGWSTDPVAGHPGGVRWQATPDSRSRHACSTGPGIQLALALALLDSDERLVAWAARAYDWERAVLLRSDDLYADRVAADGAVVGTPWSYNQGAMIGAGALLHRVTGDARSLSDAVATAAAARRRFRLGALVRQPAAFNAIYFRNLALLDAELEAGVLATCSWGGWRDDAWSYAQDRWDRARDLRTGLFSGSTSSLGATAPMIEVLALLAGAPGGP